MTWLAWRQFRANAILAAVGTTLVVAILIGTRGHIAATDPDELSTFYSSLQLLGTGLIGVPAFIGAFWGAPLVARELETGTHRLVWTQTITRSRWLLTKVAVAAVAAVVTTALFSGAFTWWSESFDAVGNRIGTANFGQRGIAPLGYALFALALGTLAGTVVRRTLPAMAISLVAFFVVRFSFQLVVRPRLLEPVTTTLPLDLFGVPDRQAGPGGWILSSHTVDATGRALTNAQIDTLLDSACDVARDSTPTDLTRCAEDLGLHRVARLHPADHFWPLQVRESLLFLIASVALTIATIWWLRRRTS